MSAIEPVSWDMLEMIYNGGDQTTDMSPVLLPPEHYEQYKELVDKCYYPMRKALNIKPYDKHHYSLDELSILETNTFVLVEDGVVICAITCNGGLIETLVVCLEHQRKGYGREMMKFAVSHIQQNGILPIRLTVARWNENAAALYKSLGFEVVGAHMVKGNNTMDENGCWGFEFVETQGLDIQ